MGAGRAPPPAPGPVGQRRLTRGEPPRPAARAVVARGRQAREERVRSDWCGRLLLRPPALLRTRSRSLPVPDIPRMASPLIPQLRSVSKQSSSLEALGACDWLLLKEAGRADWTVWSANHHGQRRSLEESASHARVCRCSNLKASSIPRFAPAGPRCVSKSCCSS